MSGTKFRCNNCKINFEIPEPHPAGDITCPGCESKDVEVPKTCSREIGPPPWEYTCQKCGGKFFVESPRGPDEAKNITCPRCGSRSIKWHFTVYDCVPSGG